MISKNDIPKDTIDTEEEVPMFDRLKKKDEKKRNTKVKGVVSALKEKQNKHVKKINRSYMLTKEHLNMLQNMKCDTYMDESISEIVGISIKFLFRKTRTDIIVKQKTENINI